MHLRLVIVRGFESTELLIKSRWPLAVWGKGVWQPLLHVPTAYLVPIQLLNEETTILRLSHPDPMT